MFLNKIIQCCLSIRPNCREVNDYCPWSEVYESQSVNFYIIRFHIVLEGLNEKTANQTKNNCHYDICIDYLLEGSTVIELGWVKCLKRVLCFLPFISILFTSPFSPLVQYTLFQIQSTARPEMCLSYEYSFCKRSIHN